jgi:hypothetical protein
VAPLRRTGGNPAHTRAGRVGPGTQRTNGGGDQATSGVRGENPTVRCMPPATAQQCGVSHPLGHPVDGETHRPTRQQCPSARKRRRDAGFATCGGSSLATGGRARARPGARGGEMRGGGSFFATGCIECPAGDRGARTHLTTWSGRQGPRQQTSPGGRRAYLVIHTHDARASDGPVRQDLEGPSGNGEVQGGRRSTPRQPPLHRGSDAPRDPSRGSRRRTSKGVERPLAS